MMRLLGRAATVLEATRSSELQDVCARGLAGWPQRRELTLPALDLQVEAHVAPLTHARALLVLRDLTAERRADRVRRDFIANASHELRTPVTAIRAAAETLLDGGLELPDQAREFVRMISRAWKPVTGSRRPDRSSSRLFPMPCSSCSATPPGRRRSSFRRMSRSACARTPTGAPWSRSSSICSTTP